MKVSTNFAVTEMLSELSNHGKMKTKIYYWTKYIFNFGAVLPLNQIHFGYLKIYPRYP